MSASSDEAGTPKHTSLDDALANLTQSLSTLRHAVETSQHLDQNDTAVSTLSAEAVDELKAIKTLISEARQLVASKNTASS